MNLSGTLRLIARVDGLHCIAARVDNTRPRAAGLLQGLPAAGATRLVPALFSLCGRAQGIATRAAVAAARGESHVAAAGDECAVSAETAREHLWRLLLDWPPRFGKEAQRTHFARVHRTLMQTGDEDAAAQAGSALRELLATELCSLPLVSSSGAGSLAELVTAARRAGGVGEMLAELVDAGDRTRAGDALAPPMPALAACDWARMFDHAMPPPEFDRMPAWHDAGSRTVFETGALARHHGSPLVARLLRDGHRTAARFFSRVLDLADAAERLRDPFGGDRRPLVDAASLGTGAGLACVESARGVLLHAVRLEGDVIADYRIVAPTEWNFRPGGAFLCEATGWQAPSRDAVRARLDRLALSLDPCVDFELVLEESGDA